MKRRLPAMITLLLVLPDMAAAQEGSIDVKVAKPLPQISQLNIVQGCIDSGGEQAVALVVQVLRRQNIRQNAAAPLTLTVTTSPCNEFAFADQGPRDLQDAPRGPLGSRIVTPINSSGKAPDMASLRLTIRNGQKTIFWDGRAKTKISPGQTAKSAALGLVLPLLDSALSQRNTDSK